MRQSDNYLAEMSELFQFEAIFTRKKKNKTKLRAIFILSKTVQRAEKLNSDMQLYCTQL